MAYHYSLARGILVDEHMVGLPLSKYTKRGYLCTRLGQPLQINKINVYYMYIMYSVNTLPQ
jgi:hypothetical protein